MNKSKIVLFDIDHTLFNTPEFKKTIYKEIENYTEKKYSVNFRKKISDIYKNSREKMGHFDSVHFISKINQKLNLNISVNFIEEIIQNEKLFASHYRDVRKVLRKLSEISDVYLGIFSGGEEKLQKSKLKSIRNFFNDKYIHIYLDKLSEIKKIANKYKTYKLYIIDDWIEVLKHAKEANNNIVTIWIRRYDNEFKNDEISDFQPDYKVVDLTNIVSIINKN